jgi:hypothetical protein
MPQLSDGTSVSLYPPHIAEDSELPHWIEPGTFAFRPLMYGESSPGQQSPAIGDHSDWTVAQVPDSPDEMLQFTALHWALPSKTIRVEPAGTTATLDSLSSPDQQTVREWLRSDRCAAYLASLHRSASEQHQRCCRSWPRGRESFIPPAATIDHLINAAEAADQCGFDRLVAELQEVGSRGPRHILVEARAEMLHINHRLPDRPTPHIGPFISRITSVLSTWIEGMTVGAGGLTCSVCMRTRRIGRPPECGHMLDLHLSGAAEGNTLALGRWEVRHWPRVLAYMSSHLHTLQQIEQWRDGPYSESELVESLAARSAAQAVNWAGASIRECKAVTGATHIGCARDWESVAAVLDHGLIRVMQMASNALGMSRFDKNSDAVREADAFLMAIDKAAKRFGIAAILGRQGIYSDGLAPWLKPDAFYSERLLALGEYSSGPGFSGNFRLHFHRGIGGVAALQTIVSPDDDRCRYEDDDDGEGEENESDAPAQPTDEYVASGWLPDVPDEVLAEWLVYRWLRNGGALSYDHLEEYRYIPMWELES